MSRAYYNEIDRDAVHVLRALIADGVIAPGDVDDRSIKDVSPDDLRGYTQCHFFAGGGLWSVAARLAGWPDERPLWTGSCPCQPFSVANKRRKTEDARDLWPDFHRLIRAGRPAVVMGEQVAGPTGRNWFDGVRADLDGDDYASRSVDIPACAVDAPNERNRLYWIAMADALCAERGAGAESCLGYRGPQAGRIETANPARKPDARYRDVPARNGSWWSDFRRIPCLDGRTRRSEPKLCLLVDGFPGRVGLQRLAGNAINPVLAAEVIGAFLDTENATALAPSLSGGT